MIAEVIVDIQNSEVDKIYDYNIVTDNVCIGSRVVVPFGPRTIEGYVIGIKQTSTYEPSKLKSIYRVVEDIPALTQEVIDLMDYMSKLYHVPRVAIIRLFIPTEMRNGKVKEKMVKFETLNTELDKDDIINCLKKHEKQLDIVNFLIDNGKVRRNLLTNLFSLSSLNTLIKHGIIIETEERECRIPYKGINIDNKGVTLTEEQNVAVNVINNSTKPVLVHGVTGSGKTEVYLNAISKVLSEGKTAIFLVPEISLTPQMFSRLRSRFGNLCAILHSGLSSGERFDEWWRLRVGEAKIAIGARSAIFAPLENIGIIVIDEEHDGSYLSEMTPRYTTSVIAKFRAKYNSAKLVFGSATPSIETYLEATKGNYDLCTMNNRVNGKPLPEISIVDMRKEVRRGNHTSFSGELKASIKEALDNHNQVILFLNRRGYSQKVICRECGFVAKCKNCDVSLKYHKYEGLLKCHYCGAIYKAPDACPDCGSTDINYSVMGTQKVEECIHELFPQARILRMDNDSTQNKESHLKILTQFGSGNADILIGTQMIAKGHDFPNVTLVGIIDGDMSLYYGDFRASENTFQLLTQVSGRCGRADRKGKVILQTYSPDNRVLNYAINYDYLGFYKYECSVRESTNFPPFTDVIRIMVESKDEDTGLNTLKNVYISTKSVYDKYPSSFAFYNKMKCPVKKVNNEYRYQVLARVLDNKEQIENLFYEIAIANNNKNVRCYCEINPGNLS